MHERLVPALALIALTHCSPPPPRADVTDDVEPMFDATLDGSDIQQEPADGLDAAQDATQDVSLSDTRTDAQDDVPLGPPFCTLGRDVPGAVVPAGFCLRRFATVNAPRTLVFAPNGDLFVGAPSTPMPGGASGGPGAVLVFSDDDHDGIGEMHRFAGNLPDVHGIALGGGYLYFTTLNSIVRTPYTVGQRAEIPGAREQIIGGGSPAAAMFGRGRFTHGLTRSQGGRLIATLGEYSSCSALPDGGRAPGSGAIFEVQVGTGTLTTLARGFRNPMYVRCHYRDEVCLASELGEDQTIGAVEKILVIRTGTDYGYPCCYRQGVGPRGPAACADVTPEEMSFPIGDTPFGLDWERGLWPEAYRHALFVGLHGSFYTTPPWQGARIVFARTDPRTHVPMGTWQDFVTGFGPGGSPLERPADVAFAPDGRMFFSDDLGNAIYWVAPTDLRMPLR